MRQVRDFWMAEALRAALAARLAPARVAVTNDVEIALRAAVPQGDALLLVAGTGSIAYGEIGERRCCAAASKPRAGQTGQWMPMVRRRYAAGASAGRARTSRSDARCGRG